MSARSERTNSLRPVWRSRLPEGYVWLDEVQIEFA